MMVYIALAVSAVLVLLDQFFKYLITENLTGVKPIIEGVIQLNYVQNPHGSFGMFEGKLNYLIVATSIVLLGAVIVMLCKKIKNPLLIWAVSLIIAGGLGNLIDRIRLRYVVDYIQLQFWPFENFPVFNFADCLVVVGTGVLIIYALFGDKIEKRMAKRLAAGTENAEEHKEDLTADGE